MARDSDVAGMGGISLERARTQKQAGATERDRSQPAFPLTIVQRLRARRLSQRRRRVVLTLNLPSPSVKASPLLPFRWASEQSTEIHTNQGNPPLCVRAADSDRRSLLRH